MLIKYEAWYFYLIKGAKHRLHSDLKFRRDCKDTSKHWLILEREDSWGLFSILGVEILTHFHSSFFIIILRFILVSPETQVLIFILQTYYSEILSFLYSLFSLQHRSHLSSFIGMARR